jgi:predicted porin
MKKSLLALAVLGAFAGVASAQSSVTLYGTVDLNAKYVKNDAAPGATNRRYSLSQDGINSSQLGFRGVEDLGGGLKAGFTLIAGVNADTGTTNSKFFNRRATVSLLGGFGEVRLGRDYTPTFWNNTIFDAFGTNGLGDSSHVLQIGSAASYGITAASPGGLLGAFNSVGVASTFVRADNSIGYFLPSNIGGVYGQFMAAAAEGGATAPGRYVGGRIGFAAGPFDIAGAYGQQDLKNVAANGKQKTYNIGASYDLGVVKLMGYFDRDVVNAEFPVVWEGKENRYSLSLVVPIGQSEIHAGYSASKLTNNIGITNDTKVNQFALGYVYNLSKRTAVYTNVSRLSNKGTAQLTVAGGTAQTAPPIAGGKSTGAEFGLRHFF